MERIRSAIEKARTERKKALLDQPEKKPRVAAEIPNLASSNAEQEALWQGLQVFEPVASHLVQNRIVAHEMSSEAVAFDVMRTRLLQQLRAHDWTRVAITSPGSSCGKTTSSLNLAFSLARQKELRTILIEMDMRRPSIAAKIGLDGALSFADVLSGRAAPEEVMVRCGENLAIATNSGAVPNAAELLMSSRVSGVLADIQDRFAPDVMIFDMPPMLAADDTMAFLGNVDCGLLIAAAESSTIKEIDLCEQDMARQTNVLGVAVNKCRYLEEGQGYGYYAYEK